MQIIQHEEALIILARSIDPRDPAAMLEAIRLLAAVCLVPPEGWVYPFVLDLEGCAGQSPKFRRPILYHDSVSKNG